jgi:hypothetical protein
MKMVAGPGIEPGTQGFSVLALAVHNFSIEFTSAQWSCWFQAVFPG